MKGAIRMAAIMECPSIFVFTHDSIGLGEDGPTHQPIEQLVHLRATPKLNVVRPADYNETVARVALRAAHDQPADRVLALAAGRRATLDPDAIPDDAIERGAYVLRDVEDPEVILIGTGTEVALALDAADALEGDLRVRVVSMPCMDTFDDPGRRPTATRVLPPGRQGARRRRGREPVRLAPLGRATAARSSGCTDFGESGPGARGLREVRHHRRGRRRRRPPRRRRRA